MNQNHQITNWISKLQALAQNGLTFAADPFDQERYEELKKIAAEMAADVSDTPFENIMDLFNGELGYQTPKLDVRGAVIVDNKILLVKETSDGLWTLPGGWAEVNESPSVSVEREVKEESGYNVKAKKLIALYDKLKHDHPPQLPHAYKCFFQCELVGGEAKTSYETSDVNFFTLDDLPDLSTHRVTRKQIERIFEHYDNPDWMTDFD